jgi:hypothetical protein
VEIRQQWEQVLSAASTQVGDRDAVLRTAMVLGLDVAPAAVACSLTERAGPGFRTVASANELALALDRAQYAAGEGPCLTAARRGAVERLDVIRPGARYPEFTAAAGRHGVRSSLSIPLADVDRPAALNFYAAADSGFARPGALGAAGLLARAVGALVRGGPGPAGVSAADLADAHTRRQVVERATAVLAGSGDGDRKAAFGLLVQRSRSEQRSVFDIAAEVVGAESGEEVAS